MHELALARIIHADRDREITAALRWRRPRHLDDGLDDARQSRTVGIASATAARVPSAGISAGTPRPSRS